MPMYYDGDISFLLQIENEGGSWYKNEYEQSTALRFDAGTTFDNDRLAVEVFNRGDVSILFDEIQLRKELIVVKEPDLSTITLMKAFQMKRAISMIVFRAYRSYQVQDNIGQKIETGWVFVEDLFLKSVTVTGVWARIRDPNLPPDLAKREVDVITFKAGHVDDISNDPNDKNSRQVYFKSRNDVYPLRRS
jgi:hypothetical protein